MSQDVATAHQDPVVREIQLILPEKTQIINNQFDSISRTEMKSSQLQSSYEKTN